MEAGEPMQFLPSLVWSGDAREAVAVAEQAMSCPNTPLMQLNYDCTTAVAGEGHSPWDPRDASGAGHLSSSPGVSPRSPVVLEMVDTDGGPPGQHMLAMPLPGEPDLKEEGACIPPPSPRLGREDSVGSGRGDSAGSGSRPGSHPGTAGSSRPGTAHSSRPGTAGSSRPGTADRRPGGRVHFPAEGVAVAATASLDPSPADAASAEPRAAALLQPPAGLRARPLSATAQRVALLLPTPTVSAVASTGFLLTPVVEACTYPATATATVGAGLLLLPLLPGLLTLLDNSKCMLAQLLVRVVGWLCMGPPHTRCQRCICPHSFCPRLAWHVA